MPGDFTGSFVLPSADPAQASPPVGTKLGTLPGLGYSRLCPRYPRWFASAPAGAAGLWGLYRERSVAAAPAPVRARQSSSAGRGLCRGQASKGGCPPLGACRFRAATNHRIRSWGLYRGALPAVAVTSGAGNQPHWRWGLCRGLDPEFRAPSPPLKLWWTTMTGGVLGSGDSAGKGPASNPLHLKILLTFDGGKRDV